MRSKYKPGSDRSQEQYIAAAQKVHDSKSAADSTPLQTYDVPPPFAYEDADDCEGYSHNSTNNTNSTTNTKKGGVLAPLAAFEYPLRSYCIRAGELLEERGRYREAICYYQRACALSRGARVNILEEVNDVCNLGLAYKRCENLAAAYQLYTRAAQLIQEATVHTIHACGGGLKWTSTRTEMDWVYEECKNHTSKPSTRRREVVDMIENRLSSLVEEMKAWNGTGHEFAAEIEEQDRKKRPHQWMKDMEDRWKSRNGGTVGLRGVKKLKKQKSSNKIRRPSIHDFMSDY